MLLSRVSASVLFVAFVSFGQAPQSSPVFEAASVKPGMPGDLRGSTFQFTPGGGVKITNGTLRGIIESAYSLRDSQILGGRGWLNSERYDIVANAHGGNIAETRLSLQTLLAERFQLKVHHETRSLPMYALVVGKSGAKLVESDAAASERSGAGIRAGCGQMTGTMNNGDQGPAADGPSLFTALQEKLGLKLEARKGPVEVLVVDRAEKADDN
jgi:hypothetical protein